MRTLTMWRAINESLHAALAGDERVFVMGEDLTTWGTGGGIYGVTRGLEAAFGSERVRSTPISEEGFVAAAVGAAMCGRRPVVEIMIADFSLQAFDPIVNQAAKIGYMFADQFELSLVIRSAGGIGSSRGAQHTQSLETLFAHVPGLEVVLPATPNDARGLLQSSIASPNPTIFLEHKALYNVSGPVGDDSIPLGVARVVRRGSDVTVIATQLMVHRAVEAAKQLAEDGIEVEIVDIRTLWPLDVETLVESARRTRRVLVCHEAPVPYGFGGEIAAIVSEACWSDLLGPIERVGGQRSPMPYAPELEDQVVPQVEVIAQAIRRVAGGQSNDRGGDGIGLPVNAPAG